jgi:fatty acid desaturase
MSAPKAILSPDLSGLRAALREAGVFEHRELRTCIELVGLGLGLAAFLAGIVMGPTWLAVLLVPLAAVLCTSISMYGHEGSHRSFSASPTRNAIMTYVTFPLFCGLSMSYWRNKHDRLHHGHPNVEGMDPDIKPFPFSSSAGGHASCGPKERWFQRNMQSTLFWPMSTLMCIGMRRSSIVHMARAPRTRAWAIEVACLAAHYTLWLVIPTMIWGVNALIVYAAIWGCVGPMLALVFAPAHMGMPVVIQPSHDWMHQIATTRNLEMPRVMAFFFVGLESQVEHHLFPKIPHANMRRAAAITREWCERHGIKYTSEPYLTALADSVRFMGTAWRSPALVVI